MKKISIFLLLIFFLTQCNKENKVIERIKKNYPFYDLGKFQSPRIVKDPYSDSYVFVNQDSTEYLEFEYNKLNRGHLIKDSIYFIGCQNMKIFADSSLVTRFNSEKSILCAFKSKGANSFYPDSNSIFISGKYYYYYNYKPDVLTDRQILFYEKNEDSIKKSMINEIPHDSIISSDGLSLRAPDGADL